MFIRSAARAAPRHIGVLIASLLVLYCIGPPAAAQQLTLAEAQRLAIARSRAIDAQDAAVVAARDMAVTAGQLPDPVATLGVNNLPINGPMHGASLRISLRVRPKAMTVAVIIAGLLPIMWGSGTGSEVMRRIAAPMVGGMITAPLLSMFVVPAAYLLMRRGGQRREPVSPGAQAHSAERSPAR